MLPWQTVNGKLFDEQGYIGEQLRSNNCNGTKDLTTAYKFAGLSIAISIHVIMVLIKAESENETFETLPNNGEE